ncbi:MAG: hypothetical protein OXP69_11870 [Spirochaetaceae bacterium]|nr:hypothetical protein [Spirochaetaceae bacterium]
MYEFEVTTFGTPQHTSSVTVGAVCRAFGFTLAVLDAPVPNNIWKVKLVREEGREVDLERSVPRGWSSRNARLIEPGRFRQYGMQFMLSGGVSANVTANVSGRASAFTAGVILSEMPDALSEIWITDIGTEMSGCQPFYVDPAVTYGGFAADLHDPVILNWYFESQLPDAL